MNNQYLPRINDRILEQMLSYTGAVLIEGAKWCGKTRTALEASASHLYMQDPDKSRAYLKAADVQPSLLLEGDTPRLIDEWQMAPVLWDAIRHTVDIRGKTGQFILTGSAVPADNVVSHTGTGRIARLHMRPMSLYESGESNGAVSLGQLFAGNHAVSAFTDFTVVDLARAAVRGGWPAAVLQQGDLAEKQAINYVEAIINADIFSVDDRIKSPDKVRALLQSLSRNISTIATLKTIRDDVAYGDDETLTEKTINTYITALKRLYVIEDIPAWNPVIRSKYAIRSSPKRQFTDPSIAAAILRLTPKRLLEDLNYFGFLFESLCDRDLRVYASAIDGDVFHYRDKSGLEADAVIVLHDGRWAAIEIKLGVSEIDKAAKNLLLLKDRIDDRKMKKPSFLMVINGGDIAYRREDGVLVVPLGCLKD